MPADKPAGSFGPLTALTKNRKEVREYCLIVEGAYLSESEAEHALRDPFIEDWVEQTGHFRIHNMNEIIICPGVTLVSLGVVMLDDRVFEIASTDADHPLTEHKAKGVAEALRRQDMFDEIRTEPRSELHGIRIVSRRTCAGCDRRHHSPGRDRDRQRCKLRSA